MKEEKQDPVFLPDAGYLQGVSKWTFASGRPGYGMISALFHGDFKYSDLARLAWCVTHTRQAFALIRELARGNFGARVSKNETRGMLLKKVAQELIEDLNTSVNINCEYSEHYEN